MTAKEDLRVRYSYIACPRHLAKAEEFGERYKEGKVARFGHLGRRERVRARCFFCLQEASEHKSDSQEGR